MPSFIVLVSLHLLVYLSIWSYFYGLLLHTCCHFIFVISTRETRQWLLYALHCSLGSSRSSRLHHFWSKHCWYIDYYRTMYTSWTPVSWAFSLYQWFQNYIFKRYFLPWVYIWKYEDKNRHPPLNWTYWIQSPNCSASLWLLKFSCL